MPFVKLPSGRKEKTQSAGRRGDAGKKRKNVLVYGERNEETNEEEETQKKSGKIKK